VAKVPAAVLSITPACWCCCCCIGHNSCASTTCWCSRAIIATLSTLKPRSCRDLTVTRLM
jgi:hypothetical protein